MSIRRDRRTFERKRLRHLRAAGCRCIPTFEPLDEDALEYGRRTFGATEGQMVRHERGCPLGDRMLALNELGLMPSMGESMPRCER